MPEIDDDEEQKRLEELRLADSFVNEALLELDRILRSRTFGRVQQNARKFLGFVVKKTLLGQSKQIKEMTIGLYAYHEPAFDPLVTRKVSVAGGSLRDKLANYYATEGMNDPIRITIPPGTFVPELHDRRVYIEVGDFRNSALKGEEECLCQAMSAEIVRCLNEIAWIRANRAQVPTVGAAGFRCWLTGCLDGSDGYVRLHVSLGSLNGTICWRCFTTHRHNAIRLAHAVARVIIHDLRRIVDFNSMAPTPHRPRSVA